MGERWKLNNSSQPRIPPQRTLLVDPKTKTSKRLPLALGCTISEPIVAVWQTSVRSCAGRLQALGSDGTTSLILFTEHRYTLKELVWTRHRAVGQFWIHIGWETCRDATSKTVWVLRRNGGRVAALWLAGQWSATSRWKLSLEAVCQPAWRELYHPIVGTNAGDFSSTFWDHLCFYHRNFDVD